ncbi:MAG: YeeE/YedE family protein [Rhodospirillales bacterium]|nr:YeeE/YedE family protein [Rhodospirillales bacterium]
MIAWTEFAPALAGGALIGLAAALLLLLLGRIAGISGIAGALLRRPDADGAWRAAFLLGLVAGPLLEAWLAGRAPEIEIEASVPTLIVAGLLVGFGTRLGSGCTSGHGVCGLARLSPRSIAAVGVFMAAAIATVFVGRHVL